MTSMATLPAQSPAPETTRSKSRGGNDQKFAFLPYFHCYQYLCFLFYSAISIFVSCFAVLSVSLFPVLQCYQCLCSLFYIAIIIFVSCFILLSVSLVPILHCYQYLCLHCYKNLSYYFTVLCNNLFHSILSKQSPCAYSR